ncbi:MAG: 50S ribosomal protein L30 [Gammaproteobacteria bacterium]|nr:50S ribosomal protein L30 [Gammaproteobacteria bacterium]
MTAAASKLKITLRKSLNRRLRAHIACVRGLGLRRIGQVVVVEDTPATRGMVKKASYLLSVEEK